MEAETVTLHDGTECASDDAVWVSDHNAYYPSDDCVRLEDGDFLPTEEAVECADGEFRRSEDTCETYDGEHHAEEVCVRLHNGEYAHQDDMQLVCLDNGDWAMESDCTEIDGSWYLSDEVSQCECCHTDIAPGSECSSPSGDYLCSDCESQETVVCYGCDEQIWRDDANYCERGGDYYCDSCYDSGSSDLVVDYSNKDSVYLPSDTPHHLRDIGIELEVESRSTQDEGARFTRTTLEDNYCVLKEDGSLKACGFEIVTRWDSVELHTEKFRKFFDSQPHKKLTSWKSGNCGMHVHVAKRTLSGLQIGKMMCFINENCNRRLVVHVAGRESGYAKLSPKKVSDALKPDYRRASLNVTDFSAEFRIFRGTLKPEGFFRNLEFVKAVVRFCEPSGRSITEATSGEAFCRWLPKADYPNLHAHLVAGGFIPAEVKK